MQEKEKKWNGVIPLDVFDLIGDLLVCYKARKEILILADTSRIYNFLLSLIEDEEANIWESLEEKVGVIIHE